MPPCLCLYSHTTHRNGRKHKIQLRMCNLFLCLILPRSRLLVRNNDAGAERVFGTLRFKIFSFFSKSFSRGNLNFFITCEVDSLHWELRTTRSQAVSRDGVEQLQITYSVLLLKWQHYCGVRRHQTCNFLAATRGANVQIFRYGCLRNSSIFWNTFIDFRLFQSRVTLTVLLKIARRLSGLNFRQLSPDFLTQPCTVLTLTEPSTGTAIEFRWKFYFLAPGRK